METQNGPKWPKWSFLGLLTSLREPLLDRSAPLPGRWLVQSTLLPNFPGTFSCTCSRDAAENAQNCVFATVALSQTNGWKLTTTYKLHGACKFTPTCEQKRSRLPTIGRQSRFRTKQTFCGSRAARTQKRSIGAMRQSASLRDIPSAHGSRESRTYQSARFAVAHKLHFCGFGAKYCFYETVHSTSSSSAKRLQPYCVRL